MYYNVKAGEDLLFSAGNIIDFLNLLEKKSISDNDINLTEVINQDPDMKVLYPHGTVNNEIIKNRLQCCYKALISLH